MNQAAANNGVTAVRNHEQLRRLCQRLGAETQGASATDWLAALEKGLFVDGGLRLSVDYLALPPWLAAHGVQLDPDRVRVLAKRIVVPPGPAATISELLFRGLGQQPASALAQVARNALASGMPEADTLARVLAAQGWYAGDPRELVAGLRVEAGRLLADRNAGRIRQACVLAGFSKHAPLDWCAVVFANCIAPLLREALRLGQHEVFLTLEFEVYRAYLRREEGDGFQERAWEQWIPDLAGAVPALPRPETTDPVREEPRVAFVLPGASLLAHTRTLLDLLGSARQADRPGFSAHVFVLGRESTSVSDAFRSLDIPVENLDSRTADGAACWTRRLAELASGIASAGCEIAIWVSNPVLMPWAFARRIAPVQVWWSLKWYGLDTPGIHARITGGAVHERSKRIAGRDWQVVPSSVRDLLRPPAASAVSALRARLPKGVLLGSLCRPEKLVGGGFLAAVARILQACPQAVYLWFGRRPDERVSREMEAHGVADRCRFMGWGDMAVYAAVLDVHLDPFSFPSGTTMLQTAARARAAVFFDSPAARENGLLPMLRPVLESGGEFGRQLQQALDLGSDGSALMLATTADEYLAFARRLVSDAGLRQRSGDALCRALGLVNDPKLTLARFAQVVQQLRAES